MVDDVEKRTEYFFIITTIVKFDPPQKKWLEHYSIYVNDKLLKKTVKEISRI